MFCADHFILVLSEIQSAKHRLSTNSSLFLIVVGKDDSEILWTLQLRACYKDGRNEEETRRFSLFGRG